MDELKEILNRPKKEIIKDLALVLFGNLLIAIASVYFVIPMKIINGGVAGLAVVINKFIPIEETTLIYFLVIGLFFVGWIFLGHRFAIGTGISSIVYPILVSVLSLFPYELELSREVGAIYAGILVGVGIGAVFRTGGSTGGSDVFVLLLNKYLHIEIGVAELITDGILALLGVVAYGIEAVLIGVISVIACSLTVDKVLLIGGEQAKLIYINSLQWKEINEAIQAELDRGTTLLQAKGGYSQNDRTVIMCAVNQRQYGELSHLIRRIDPTAFIVVSDAVEVAGEGFTFDPDQCD